MTFILLNPDRTVGHKTSSHLRKVQEDFARNYPHYPLELYRITPVDFPTPVIKDAETASTDMYINALGDQLKHINKYKYFDIEVEGPNLDSHIGGFKVTISDGETQVHGVGIHLVDAIAMAEKQLSMESIKAVQVSVDAAVTKIEPVAVSAAGLKINK